MIQRVELKELAKSQLKGRWKGPVLLTLILALFYIVVGIISNSTPAGGLVSLLIAGPIIVGYFMYYLEFTKTTSDVDFSVAFKGFGIFGKSLGMYLWYLLWVLLWSLLLYIPGIVKSIAYSQCFYIIAENPGVTVRDALKTSMKMTQGYKWDMFVMYLSFIGWALLCALTLGIGLLWLYPYMSASFTNLYKKLKEMSLANGACTPADFGMEENVLSEE